MGNDRRGWIYALTDPLSHKPRYIGQTTGDPESRLQQHVYDHSGSNRRKQDWIQGLIKAGMFPRIVVLERPFVEMLDVREREWTRHYAGLGYDLLNMPAGAIAREHLASVSFWGEQCEALRLLRGAVNMAADQIRQHQPLSSPLLKRLEKAGDLLRQAVEDVKLLMEVAEESASDWIKDGKNV